MTNPNWALAEARSAVDDFRNATSVSEVERAANKLSDTFDALDEWLCKGGFLPADWLVAANPDIAPRTLGDYVPGDGFRALAAGQTLRAFGREFSDLDIRCTCGMEFETTKELVDHAQAAHQIEIE